MPTTKNTIQAFLVSDIATAVTAISLTGAVYAGQRRRVNFAPFEARVRAGSRDLVPGVITGTLRRHRFEIELTSFGHDASEEETLTDQIGEAADELVDRYDGQGGGLVILSAGTSEKIERVSCRRQGEIKMELSGRNKTVTVDLDLDVWEA